ncbi:MAG: Flp pilus assembly complex ATPase component TadA [Candidatus Omnitrophica bacterium]|jgi:type II secretory ATPase GspE/PulE/Tfp pilus assembly ATPase PilB-like protein|nr:Flp pilus assembly complex ATPase component TadA [Candidatus Omnitrophota bacterium]
MPVKDEVLVGKVLIEKGIISLEQLEMGLAEQKKCGGLICAILVKLGFASQEKIFEILAEQLGVAYIELKDKHIDPLVIGKVPAKFASHYKIIPIEFENQTITIAMANPLDIRTIDDIRLLVGLEVKAALSSEPEIEEAIRKYYGVGADTLEKIIAEKPSGRIIEEKAGIEDVAAFAQDASIVKFVNQILSEAVKDRATDIHIEPFQDELRVRFRIDGVLYNINIPEAIKHFHHAIVSRIKVMAQMNIAERRLPQDGRIKIKIKEEELDLRISTIPTTFGEAVHMRILGSKLFLDLESLGLLDKDLKIMEEMIKKPHGIVFVTGPTGSGKSTTLYAALSHINSENVKIITIEDPVEYQLKGVNQIQIFPKIGLTFATALRHMLRHDPDAMMVGEVRDYETAEIAIRAALTGHLVFSTLHTNDAAGAVTRLLDMGIEPFLVSSSLECLIAQRLVRVICPSCKCKLDEHKRKAITGQIGNSEIIKKDVQLYEGKGCAECRFTGYKGRTAIYEILVMTESIREMVLKRGSAQAIKQKAISCGMHTLRQDGLRKVWQGVTTFAEVFRVTQKDGA